jgi:hypothetical protein
MNKFATKRGPYHRILAFLKPYAMLLIIEPSFDRK